MLHLLPLTVSYMTTSFFFVSYCRASFIRNIHVARLVFLSIVRVELGTILHRERLTFGTTACIKDDNHVDLLFDFAVSPIKIAAFIGLRVKSENREKRNILYR